MPLLYFASSIMDGAGHCCQDWSYLYRFYWGARERRARENGGSSKLLFMTQQQRESERQKNIAQKEQDFIGMLSIVKEGVLMCPELDFPPISFLWRDRRGSPTFG